MLVTKFQLLSRETMLVSKHTQLRARILILFLTSQCLSFIPLPVHIHCTPAESRFSQQQLVPMMAQGTKDDESNEDTTALPHGSNSLSRIEAVRKLLKQENQETTEQTNINRRDLFINTVAGGLLIASGVAASQLYKTTVYTPNGFVRYPQTRFIAALGDPKASEGEITEPWGLWRLDPGPRGVWLRDYEDKLASSPTNTAPAGWTYDPNDWWLEEHGLIMEQPEFPLPSGRYLVTGGRSTTTGITVTDKHWKLDEGATLYDVTHLPCRAARYHGGSPARANLLDFPVAPGAIMPSVPGTNKQDYAVLFLVGRAQ